MRKTIAMMLAGALAMMAHWDLHDLQAQLPRLAAQLHLLTGSHDLTVSPKHSNRVLQYLPNAHCQSFTGLGHLAHEERPDLIAQAILSIGS